MSCVSISLSQSSTPAGGPIGFSDPTASRVVLFWHGAVLCAVSDEGRDGPCRKSFTRSATTLDARAHHSFSALAGMLQHQGVERSVRRHQWLCLGRLRNRLKLCDPRAQSPSSACHCAPSFLGVGRSARIVKSQLPEDIGFGAGVVPNRRMDILRGSRRPGPMPEVGPTGVEYARPASN